MVCWGHLHCAGVNRTRWACLCRPITTIVSLSTFRSWRAFLHGKQWMCQKQFTIVRETRPLPIAINEPLKCWSLWINVVFVVWFYKPSACFFTLSMKEILMRKQSEMKKASHGCAGLWALSEKEKKQCEIGIVRLLIIDECCVGSQITSCPSVCIHPRQAACPPQEVGQNCLPLSQKGSWRPQSYEQGRLDSVTSLLDTRTWEFNNFIILKHKIHCHVFSHDRKLKQQSHFQGENVNLCSCDQTVL